MFITISENSNLTNLNSLLKLWKGEEEEANV